MISNLTNCASRLAVQVSRYWAYLFQSPEERAIRSALSRARDNVKDVAQLTEYLENITQLYLDPDSTIFLENKQRIADNKRFMREQRELIAEYESLCAVMRQ